MTGFVPAEITITPGEHPTRNWFGLTVNLDTVTSTLVAGVIVLLLGLLVRRALTRNTEDHVPTKLQLIWESVVGEVNRQVEDNLGKVHPYVAPLAIALFFFILFCNWLEWFPSGHHPEYLPPPTSDTNLTFALTAVVVIGYTYVGFKHKRGRYVTDMITAKPPVVGAFIKIVIDQIANPLALALRLFGNVLASGIMFSVIGLLPLAWIWLYGPANVVWKLFDVGLILSIQAFIFAFLTILYFGFAVEEEH